MAATYRVMAKEVVLGNGKSLLALFNGGGSADILKVDRIWLLNNQIPVFTGILTIMELRLITAHTTGTLVLPTKNVLSSANLDVNVIASTGATVTETNLFKRIIWSADEPGQNENNMDSLELLTTINVIWDSSYVDTRLEPLTLNAGQGIHIKCATNTTASNIGTIVMEFTT